MSAASCATALESDRVRAAEAIAAALPPHVRADKVVLPARIWLFQAASARER